MGLVGLPQMNEGGVAQLCEGVCACAHHTCLCRCAECLGLLGAVDPARVKLTTIRPEGITAQPCEFLVDLVEKHLVGMIRRPHPLATHFTMTGTDVSAASAAHCDSQGRFRQKPIPPL
jgi:hypothetical protein